MDHKEAKKQTPSSLLPNSTIIDSPTKQPNISCGGGGGGGGDRLKRDEWSEGAVSTLLEAYEAKWVLRNRAKLKGHDWEDVAKYVSCRANSTKTPKTQTQCKNKIESMKKRYRSESATADPSSWPLFPRLDLLLRGSAPPPPPPPLPPPAAVLPPPPPLMLIQPLSQSPPAQPLRPPPEAAVPISVASPSTLSPAPPPPQLHLGVAQISHESNGFDRITKEDGMNTKMSDHLSDKNDTETASSTPNLYSTDKEKLKSKNNEKRNRKRPRRRRGDEESEIAESIRWLAEVVAKSEKERVETMREMEKMRAESEAKRSEMDLKRTEIVANTQLEIARLFAGTGKGAVDHSLRIGRS